jgi:hypothetical protein
MPQPFGKGKASPMEQEKLIEEIQTLIKEKGLNVKLDVPPDVARAAKLMSGCATCTLCPCMICW